MLPTARLYTMTPFYNMMNNQDTFVQLLLKPVEKVGVRTEFHWLRLTEPRDLAYFGSGALKEDLDGHVFGEDILRDAFASSDANYGFIETTLSFG
jgi:hypothetical protein